MFIKKNRLFISMLLLFTVVIPNQPIVLAADVPYLIETFDDYSGGSATTVNPVGWSLFGFIANEDYAIGEQVSGRDNKSLKLVTNNAGKPNIYKSYSSTPITGQVAIEANIRLTDTEHERSIYEMKSTENGSVWITILKLTTDGKIKVNGTLDIGSYEADTWYHIKAIMDHTNKTLDIYINGELKADKFSLNDKWSSITSIKFSQTGIKGKTGGMYIDDIVIKDYVAPVNVSGVTLQKNTHTMGISDTYQLIPTITPDTAANKDVTWKSSDEAIATVDGGMVTGVAEGNADITVTTLDGSYTATCTITVDKSPAPKLLPNGSFELTETSDHWLDNKGPTGWSIYPNTNVPELTLDKSDAKDGGQAIKVHTDTDKRTDINQNVLVDVGHKYLVSTWIKTKDVSNNAYLRVQVTNNGSKVDNLSLSSTKLKGTHGDWTKVELEVYVPTKANGIKIEHMFDTGTGTAWFDDTHIEKLPRVAVNNITLDDTQKEVEQGKTTHLTKTITPVDATNQEVQWESSDVSIATVDDYGVVTALQEGTVTITVATKDSGKTASCQVTVKKGVPIGPVNLLKNNSFEVTENQAKWTNNIAPIVWGVWMPKGDTPLTVDTAEKKEGNQSIRIDIPTPTKKRVAIGQTVTVEGGKKYKFGSWIKTDNVDSKAGIYVRTQFLKDGTKLSINGNGPSTEPLASEMDTTKTHDWIKKEMAIKVPSEANGLKVELFFEEGTGIAWFDDITLIEEGKYVMGFKLDQDFAMVDNNATVTLNPIFTPVDSADQTITWSSSDESVATVTGGVVKADVANKGLATITAVTKDGNLQAQCRIFVGKEGTFNVNNIQAVIDEEGTLKGKIEPTNAVGLTFTYTLLESPINGTAYVLDSGDYFYSPNDNYNGNDQFSIIITDQEGGSKVVEVQVTVNPVNDVPVYRIEWFTTVKNNPVSGTIKVNDPDEEAHVYTIKTNSTHGQINLASDGSFTYTPQADYVGYDHFETSITDNHGGDIQHKISIFIQPPRDDIHTTLVNHSSDNQHPRLLVTKDKINEIKANILSDDYTQQVYNHIKESVDANLGMDPTPYSKKSTGMTRGKVIDASILYQITKDTKYAAFVWKELETVADYPEWGLSNSMLGAAEMTFAMAFGYDMIYDYMNEQQRLKIRNAIRDKALKEFLKVKYGERDNNINYVINGNMGLGALAIFEDEQETAGIVLEKTLKDIQLALRYYSDDGAWPEGPLYWAYGGQYLTYYTAALNNALGIDYGISQLEGFKNSGSFPVYLEGEKGTFNFADGGGAGGARPESMWFASHYNKPEYAWTISDFFKRKNVKIGLSLLFYEKGMLDKKPEQLDKTYKVVETATFRSNWADDNAVFAAMKGFNSQMKSHADLDSGTFVLDALGVRWAIDLGTDNYALPGFWDNNYQRWTYYRKKPEGHNTLVMNPKENPVLQQDPEGVSRIIDTVSKPKGAYSILDMSDAYAKDAIYAKRGMKLFNNRTQIMIQDEVKMKKPSELYWFMHTKADIKIIENGKAALLTQEGKKLYVKLLTNNSSGAFSVMDAAALPTSPNPHADMQKSNAGIRKLALHMDGVLEETITVWMVPLLSIEKTPTVYPAVTPLNSWSIEDGQLDLPQLNGITIDGKPMDNFDPSFRVMNVDLPFGTKHIPHISASGNHTFTIEQAKELPGTAIITVENQLGQKSVYYVQFNVSPLIGRPSNGVKHPIAQAGVTASNHDGNMPSNTVDGDMNTRWSAEGQQWVQYDLGQSKQVQYISIAFFNGDQRQTIFDVEVSSDGTNWKKLISKKRSSGLTGDMETFEVTPVSAQYIRIMGYGNTSNQWNSMKEVEIYGPKRQPSIHYNTSNDHTNEDSQEPKITPKKLMLKKTKIHHDTNPFGKKRLKANISEQEVNELLASHKKTQLFVAFDDEDTAITHVQIPMKAIKKMAENDIELALKTKDVQLNIPLEAIQQTQIAEALQANEQDIEIAIQIEVVQEKQPQNTNQKEQDNTYKPITKVLSFQIEAITEDETFILDDFGHIEVEGQFPYTDEEVKNIKELGKLNVYKFHEEKGKWEPRRSIVDADQHIVYFYTNSFSDYTILENDVTFKDIKNHSAQKNIEFLASKHIIHGKNAFTFDPDTHITKAELIQLVVNALGLKATHYRNPFMDVTEDDWYYEAVIAASEYDLIHEDDSHVFKPHKKITKERMVSILMKVYNQVTGEDYNQLACQKEITFKDSYQISSWAKQAVNIALDKGFISINVKNKFEPQAPLTRAETIDMIFTLLTETNYY